MKTKAHFNFFSNLIKTLCRIIDLGLRLLYYGVWKSNIMLMKNLEAPSSTKVKRLVSLNRKSMSNHKFTDEELVAKYKASRDHQYLTELFTRHSDVIYRNALRKMKNPADAEDIVQIAFIKMVTDLLNFKGTGSVIGWMLQVVIFTCYDRLRSEKSRKNRDKKIMSERTQMTTPKNYELTEMIEAHLNKLPEIYKLPITLQIMDGLTVKEVSDTLNIPEKTIRSQIARGLEKLKTSLQSVGVTASIISVGDMLKGIQQPMAPEIFKSSQYFNSLFKSKAATSTKLAISAGSKSIVLKCLLSILLLFVIATIAFFIWNNIVIIRQPTKSLFETTKMSQKWDFENTKDVASYQDIGIKKGGISIAESIGVNGTNGLMVEEKTLIELNISKFKLPIRITYSCDYFAAKKHSGLHVLNMGNYKKDQKVLRLSQFSEHYFIQFLKNSPNAKLGFTGKPISHVYYVDETSIDHWEEGRRFELFLGSTIDHKKVLLFIPGKVIIDDLIIESIDKSILPNISEFEKATSAIAYKEGVDVYSLDKEKIGLDKNSKANPNLTIYTPETLENMLGVNNEVSYPILSEKNKVEWVKNREKLTALWNFEDRKQFYEFKLIKGNLVQAGEQGVNGSMCMGVEANSLFEFDISRFTLPIKISYSYDNLVPKLGMTNLGIFMVKGNCQKDKNILSFLKLSPAKQVDTTKMTNRNNNKQYGFFGEWFSAAIYVSDECVDLWFNGNRTALVYVKSNDNKKLYFHVLDKSFIDNILIESIDKESVPDTSKFTGFAATLPIINGFKDYYKLDKEKELLGLDKNSSAELGICDSATLEKTMGLNNGYSVKSYEIDTEKEKSSKEFLTNPK
jgi:RNA polymerase sigma-70 factor (ECF subfamily)